MSVKDIEKMKAFLEQKKSKEKFLKEEAKVGSGVVEKGNKNIRIGWEGSKKISH